MACDTLLCLDELSQIDPRAAGAASYMLANGKGKARAGRDGGPRKTHEWRVLFLSSGEISLADKIAEAGGRGAAGVEVRVIDLPADAGAGLGLFETLHGADNAATFAESLKAASGRYYGTAARAFLHASVQAPEEWRNKIAGLRRGFVASAVPAEADGQVRRVAERFALVAAAGEIAAQLGITGWEAGEAKQAAERCFRDWLASRGGIGAYETMEAKRWLAEAIETYGAARFQSWEPDPRRVVITPRYGFVKREGEDETARIAGYFFTPPALRDILVGLDFRRVVETLCDEGVIRRQDGKPNKPFHVPGDGRKHRLYEICPDALLGARTDGHG